MTGELAHQDAMLRDKGVLQALDGCGKPVDSGTTGHQLAEDLNLFLELSVFAVEAGVAGREIVDLAAEQLQVCFDRAGANYRAGAGEKPEDAQSSAGDAEEREQW